MSCATARVYESTAHQTKDRSLESSRRVVDADRAEQAEGALRDYEITAQSRLHTLDLIGAESVYFLDTWAL